MSDPRLSGIAEHTSVAVSIRRAKAWGGLVGFAIAFLTGYVHGATTGSALSRALAGGAIGYLAVWAAAVTVWRHLLIARARRALRSR